MTGAYYNEIDPKAAAWLRELIKAGAIAPGEVDERSILDVTPAELAGFTQHHFFAGIGVWSYALRLARWPDDRPVWTGSCPCQPFSAAGKGDGFDDERHLWPHWFHLIEQCRPAVLFGEQVASKHADPWIDLVQDDLEALGYAFGAVAFPAAGVGAPHIRDRTYWLANADGARSFPSPLAGVHRGEEGAGAWHGELERPSSVGGVGDASGAGAGRDARATLGAQTGVQGSGDSDGHHSGDASLPAGAVRGPGPTNGLWRDADWLYCRDGKWRPVEPGTFPLAHGAAARVGRLRGYGNAIVAEAAAEFIRASQGVGA